jgi:hypothetical protein
LQCPLRAIAAVLDQMVVICAPGAEDVSFVPQARMAEAPIDTSSERLDSSHLELFGAVLAG